MTMMMMMMMDLYLVVETERNVSYHFSIEQSDTLCFVRR